MSVRTLSCGVLLLTALGCANEPAVSTESEQAYARYQQGLDELRRYNLKQAEEQFTAAVAADSSFAVAHLFLGRTMMLLGQPEKAKDEFTTAQRLGPSASDLERLQIEHSCAAYQRNQAAADTAYGELQRRFPDDAYTLEVTAGRAWRDLDYAQAVAAYARVLTLDPTRVDMHNLLGYLHLEAGQYGKAIESFQRYVYYAPDFANPHDSLGDALSATGQYEEAMVQYQAALAIDPSFLHSSSQLARLLTVTGQLHYARSLVEKTDALFLSYHQTSTRDLILMGIDECARDWAALQQRAATTLEELDASLDMERDAALRAATYRVFALAEMGQLEAARQARQRVDEILAVVTKKDESDGKVNVSDWVRLIEGGLDCRIARAAGRPAEAVDALAKAIESAQQSPHELEGFRLELARARLAAGAPEQALSDVEQILRVVPTQPRANLLGAQILAELGRSEEALRNLSIYFEVMGRADDDLPELVEARQLARRFAVAN